MRPSGQVGRHCSKARWQKPERFRVHRQTASPVSILSTFLASSATVADADSRGGRRGGNVDKCQMLDILTSSTVASTRRYTAVCQLYVHKSAVRRQPTAIAARRRRRNTFTSTNRNFAST